MDDDCIPAEVIEKKMSQRDKLTLEGVMVEVQELREQVAQNQEQMRHLIGLYQTLQGQFEQFNQQRIRELQVKVNGGPTA